MSYYEITNDSIEQWINLFANSINTNEVKTTNVKSTDLDSATIHVKDTATINKLNYNELYHNNIKLRLNPLFYISTNDITFKFVKQYYIDFELPNTQGSYDVDMERKTNIRIPGINSANNNQYKTTYTYKGLISMKVSMDISLIYKFYNTDHSPRFAFKIYLNNVIYRSLQCGLSDIMNDQNVLNASFLIDVITGDTLYFIVEKDPTDMTQDYLLYGNSFICFKQVV